jgi:uncharacterized protein with NAD-binding domain and iron-sulfur cluster
MSAGTTPSVAAPNPIKVAIVGAGPSGLAAAWGLTQPHPGENAPAVEVTVYERSWRAGGKCTSTRLAGGQRIVQNGTHYMFGVFFNTLGIIQEAHAEINDARYGEAADFVPRNLLALKRFLTSPAWENWKFGMLQKGAGLPAVGDVFQSPESYLADVFRWLKDELIAAGLLPDSSLENWISGLDLGDLSQRGANVIANLGGNVLGDLLDLLIEKAMELAGASGPVADALRAYIQKTIEVLRFAARELLKGSSDPTVVRIRILLDFVLTILRGILADGVLTGQIAQVDEHDLTDWLALHGAQIETQQSPFVRVWYDIVAAYEEGDESKPSISAAAFLQTFVPALVAYRGAFCYQMKAEVGESFIVPVYKALADRGVRFRFLHELEQIVPDAGGTRIERLVFRVPKLPVGAPGAAATALAGYDPLVETPPLKNGKTRFTWPRGPKPPFDFLGEIDENRPLLLHPCGPARETVTLERASGDFDHVVFTLPHTVVPKVAPQLVAQKQAWKDLVDELPSVETKSLRIWVKKDLAQSQWDPADAATPPVLSAYLPLFNTWEDSGQQLEFQNWPSNPPLSIASVLGPLKASRHPPRWQLLEWLSEIFQRLRARNEAQKFLIGHAAQLWPGLVGATGAFDWTQLVPPASGPSLAGQWVVANTGACERYTHATPGSFKYRLRSRETGYANLAVAGEWTRFWPATANMELAVISGLRAAFDILGVSTTVRSEKGFFPSA